MPEKLNILMFSLQLNNKLRKHNSMSIEGGFIVQTGTAKLWGVTIDHHL